MVYPEGRWSLKCNQREAIEGVCYTVYSTLDFIYRVRKSKCAYSKTCEIISKTTSILTALK